MANNKSSNIIEAALNEVISNTTGNESGDIVVDWILVAYVANTDEGKGEGIATYVSNGYLPSYKAIGLLRSALQQLGDD